MLRCVILDDEPMILRSMRKKIETLHSGFEVVGTATDGKQGLRLILEQHPDCVFTDINMPVIDGLELIERVQAQCSEPPVFVIMSGYSEFAFARKALRLNVIDYLIKPVSNANLVALLAEIEARLLQDIHQKTAAAIDKLLDNLAEERDLHVVQKQLDSGRGCFYAAKICVGPFLTQRFHHIRLERRTDNIFDFDSVCSDCCNAGESYSIHYDNYFNERTLFFRIQQDPDTFLSKLLAAIRRHLGENLHVTCILTPPLKSAEQLGRLREVLDHALYDSAIFSRSNFVQMGPEWTCPARTSVEIDDALMRSVDLLSSVAAAQRLPVVQELLGICSEQCCPQIQLVRVIRKLLAATDRGGSQQSGAALGRIGLRLGQLRRSVDGL